jgi:hypothetical protein
LLKSLLAVLLLLTAFEQAGLNGSTLQLISKWGTHIQQSAVDDQMLSRSSLGLLRQAMFSPSVPA